MNNFTEISIAEKRSRFDNNTDERRQSTTEKGRSTSCNAGAEQVAHYSGQQVQLTEAEKLIQQAEQAKARILEVPGKEIQSKNLRDEFLAKVSGELMHSVIVDEEFSMVASHVSEATKRKIVNGEYVDFIKLLPREDWNAEHEESDMDQFIMINKGGHAYWAPESDVAESRRTSGVMISSLHKWEQAFRIFSHIYSTADPSRATELTQYSFIIHDAAQSFPWENVYGYDVILEGI